MASVLKQKTAKGLVWGGAITMLQQMLALVFGAIIARILSPSDYGMVGMLNIFTALATLLQESGFVYVLTNREGINKIEYSSVFWFNILVSLSIYTVFFITAPLLGLYFMNDQIVPLSRYVFLGFFISSFGIIQSAVLYKQMRVKERLIASFVGFLFAGIIGIVLALNGFAYWGLATQSIVATLVSTTLLWFFSPFRPLFKVDFKFLKSILPDGLRFSLPNLISVVSVNIYSLILGRYYTVKDVGFYSQAAKFETYGYSVTLGMIRDVSQPMFVQVKDNPKQLLSAFRKMVRFTGLVSLPLMFGISLIAPEFVSVLLSPKWYYSGLILRILCIGGAFVALSTLATYYFVSENKSALYMWLGIIGSSIRIVFAVFSSFWGIMSLAYTLVSLDIIGFIVYYTITNRLLHYSFIMILEDLAPILISTMIAILFSFLITSTIDNTFELMIAKSILYTILFIGILNFWKFDVFEEAKGKVLGKLKKI